MVQRVAMFGNGRKSYEVSSEEDIKTLETTAGQGSIARVVGITAEYELKGGSWVKTAGGSALPAVTSDDNGKVLSVVDGAWAADDTRLVVMCTPTAEDFSGTMDKTVGEIFAAWADGKEIYFSIINYGAFPVGGISDGGQFFAYGVLLGNPGKLIVLQTYNMGNRYSTTIYQLTPMGG